MARIEKSIEINAPANVVFEHIQNLDRWPEWWPRLRNATGHKSQIIENGSTYDYVHQMLGLPLNGKGTITELIPNKQASMTTEGGIDSKWDLRVDAAGDKTKVSATVEYTVPGQLFGRVADALVIERLNSLELEYGLENLKSLSEHRQQRSA
jgi:uncharacterized membrane protein